MYSDNPQYVRGVHFTVRTVHYKVSAWQSTDRPKKGKVTDTSFATPCNRPTLPESCTNFSMDKIIFKVLSVGKIGGALDDDEMPEP